MGIEKSVQVAHQSDLVVWIVDPTDSLDQSLEALQSLDLPEQKIIVMHSKADLIQESQKDPRKIYFSSFTQKGIDQVIAQMVAWAKKMTHRAPKEVLLTQEEQQNAIQNALTTLKRSLQAEEMDLFASDLRQSLYDLSALMGQTTADDLLARIFSKFCIGK